MARAAQVQAARAAEARAAAAPLGRREWLPVLGALLAAWVLLFAPQLFAGRVFVLGDAVAYRPYAEFSRARWHQHHERTYWNPYVFAGIPATASLADPRPQYLPDALLDASDALAGARGLPPLAGPLLAHLAGMIAAAALARALWGARGAGMAWAGIAWGMTPNLVVPLGFGHGAQFVTASLMPVALLGVHGIVAAATPRAASAAALGLALTLALGTVAGHPQFVAFTVLLAAVFAVERALHHGRLERLLLAAGGAALGAAMAAAVWAPAMIYGATSVRGGRGLPLGEVGSFSFALRDYLSLAWPWGVGFGDTTYWGGMRGTDYPNYLGAVALLALPFAWTARRDEERGAVAVLAIAGAAGLVMALGARLPGYAALYGAVPLVASLRVAVAGLIVTQLAAALLSARGIGRVLAGARPPRWVLPAAGATFLLAAALTAGGPLAGMLRDAALAAREHMGGDTATRAGETGARDLALRLALVALALGTVGLRGAGRRWRPLALGALLACDLATVDLLLLARASGTPKQLEPPAPPLLAQLAAGDPLARVYPLGEMFYSNAWISWRARSIGGLHGAVDRYWDELRREGLLQREGVLRALAMRWFAGADLRPQDTTKVERIAGDSTGMSVWRVRNPLSRAWAVPEVITLLDDFNVLRGLYDRGFVPERVAYTTARRPAGRYGGSSAAKLRWRRDDPDRLELDVDAPAEAFVVIADAWSPGWNAALDGAPAPLYRVDHLLRGVAVPAGAHRLTMRYEPPGWSVAVPLTRGAWLLWLALAVACGAWLVRGRGAKVAEAPPAGA